MIEHWYDYFPAAWLTPGGFWFLIILALLLPVAFVAGYMFCRYRSRGGGRRQWSTFVLTAPMQFAVGEAFAVTAVSEEGCILQPVDAAPVGTVLLLHPSGQSPRTLSYDPSPIEANLLRVSDGTVTDAYVLTMKDGEPAAARWAGEKPLSAGRVYIKK